MNKPKYWGNNEWIVVFIATFLLCVFYALKALNVKEIIEMGRFSLENNRLKLETENLLREYETEEIKLLKCKVLGFRGQTLYGANSTNSGTRVINSNENQLQGYENYIILKLKNRRKVKYNFFLSNKKEYDELKKMSDTMIKNRKIEFKFAR